jgi:hypothetical protein
MNSFPATAEGAAAPRFPENMNMGAPVPALPEIVARAMAKLRDAGR